MYKVRPVIFLKSHNSPIFSLERKKKGLDPKRDALRDTLVVKSQHGQKQIIVVKYLVRKVVN
jgi:hypothetical protein